MNKEIERLRAALAALVHDMTILRPVGFGGARRELKSLEVAREILNER